MQHWQLVEIYRTQRGPRQRVVAYLGDMDECGQLCQRAGLGDEPRRVFDEIGQIQMVDVVLATRSGVSIRRGCVAQPTKHQAILLHRLGLTLPTHLEVRKM